MQKHISQWFIVLIVAGVFSALPLRLRADETTPRAGSTPSTAVDKTDKTKRADRIPFHGKIAAVDRTALTLTLEGKEKKRVIHLTPDTRMLKAGKPATLADAVVGEEVGGQTAKTLDGREEAISLRFGPKPESNRKEKKADE
jgi:hypothetical protein